MSVRTFHSKRVLMRVQYMGQHVVRNEHPVLGPFRKLLNLHRSHRMSLCTLFHPAS